MLDQLAPARRRLALALAAAVAVAMLAGAGTLVWRWQNAPDPVAQDRPGPVVVVAGYGGGTASLGPLVSALRAEGREVALFPPVGDNTGDLEDQARRLGIFVDEVRARTGSVSVDVVGYSAGAAVARRVLTVASPHHGTSVAGLATQATGCPVACEQLDPDSDLLRRLNAGDETPAGPQWATVRTATDQVVTPSVSADLTGAVTMVVQEYCPGATTSHGQLPSSPLVLAAVRTILGAGPPVAPASGSIDCEG
jgi:pimeloyl-ACP methyl ester carboxylesterase